jgi:hypothetical protein
MPYRDRTGPLGAGPGTGKGFGPCAGGNSPWYGFRGGFGAGRGFGSRGRGMGRGGFAVFPPAAQINEKEYLDSEINMLEKHLETLKKRAEEIESGTEK